MTLKEFALIQKGFVERFEIEQREHWERARWQSYIQLQPHIKSGSIRKPSDLIKFDWEETKEEIPDPKLWDIFPDRLPDSMIK